MSIFSKPAIDWIVVFLGNPGPKYAGTRHNAGFMAADASEKDTGEKILKVRFRALTAQAKVGEARVLLMKPQTFMNLSGDAVIQAVNFYKVPPEHVMVISDEVALPPAKLRIRRSGSAGGHNGLKSIIARLGTENFPRVRIGVGAPPHPDYDMADWVLSSFQNADAETIRAAAKAAAEACVCFVKHGADKAMTQYNQKPQKTRD